MKNILFLDRNYLFKHIKSEKYNSIFVSLKESGRKELESLGQNVVGCFESQYSDLEVADFVDDYLLYSYDSDRFLNRFSFEKRREILGKEISFWCAILDKYKPVCIVSEVVTIEWMEVLYIEARRRNIPYHSFLYGFNKGYCYWLDNPFNSEISSTRWTNLKIENSHKLMAREFFDGVRDKHAKPYYIQNVNYSNIKSLLSGIRYYCREYYHKVKQKGFVYGYYSEAAVDMINRGVKSMYKKHDSLDDINTNNHEYLFYPLHYEPEATLSYFSEYYSNQLNNICNIAHSLNTNQVLIVKEHPQQINMLLLDKYSRLKKTYKNVLYIRGDVSSYDIFKKISAIVTLTGTGGIEGMILGIPVITLGHVFYNYCESTNVCRNMVELKNMIRKKTYKKPDPAKILSFLEHFFALTERGYAYSKYIGDQDENYRALCAKLEIFLTD